MSNTSRGTVLIWVLAAGLGLVALLRVVGGGGGSGGDAAGSPIRIDRSAGGSAQTDGAPEGAAGVYVHVAGAVRRPGLVRVPKGSRVAAAVRRAGGPSGRADLAGVNLAARVEDGQQVVVPGAAGSPGAGASAGTGTATGPGAGKPSLGSATADQLDALDGIGPTLAKRIVEYRTKHGGFHSIGELRQVEGIGEKRFEALRGALQP